MSKTRCTREVVIRYFTNRKGVPKHTPTPIVATNCSNVTSAHPAFFPQKEVTGKTKYWTRGGLFYCKCPCQPGLKGHQTELTTKWLVSPQFDTSPIPYPMCLFFLLAGFSNSGGDFWYQQRTCLCLRPGKRRGVSWFLFACQALGCPSLNGS